MAARATEAAALFGVAVVLTLALAAPVLRAPTERIFGRELVGRHYDPFTAMERFAQPIRWTALLQPATDVPGAVLATVLGPVASLNVVVLATFPLTALASFLLARHCAVSTFAAVGVALAVAFSPFHIAQAAYHPHVAQLQWLPLYLLALWRCLDRPTARSAVALLLAIGAVTLSNFYGGLIAAAITPVAFAAYWFFLMRSGGRSIQRVFATVAVVAGASLAGIAYASFVGASATNGGDLLAFADGDAVRYSASWRGYLAPAAANPLFGSVTSYAADSATLEQQLTLGIGLLALAAVAVIAWACRRADGAPLSYVPVLAAVALAALWCSLAPGFILTGTTPMFRSYARFGSVVQLMLALLAGIGAQYLWASRSTRARIAVLALVLITVAEYAVWPPALWRDVLPTAAHRWAAGQPGSVHVLDCYPYSRESQSVQWLTAGRVILRPESIADCRDTGLNATLAATGFTHLLIRRATPEGEWFAQRPVPDGFRLSERFDDASVWEVAGPSSPIRTVRSEAFYPVEFDDHWTWRWMGPQASWSIVNVSERWLLASVELQIAAFHEPRHLTITLDGKDVHELLVDPQRRPHTIGPIAVPPGAHTLTFRAAAPQVADAVMHNGDPRALSLAFGDWRWSVNGGQP